MFKLKNNKKGGMTIETIVIISVILTAAIVFFSYLFIKMDKSQNNMEKGLTENYKSDDLVIHVEPTDLNEIPDGGGIGDENKGDELLNDPEKTKELVSLSMNLERTKVQDRELTVVLEGLDELVSFKANNGGKVQIVSVDGDKVTIKVIGGTPTEYVVISGEYIPATSKYVTNYPTPSYIDENGYKGTLTRYVHQTIPNETRVITQSLTSLVNNFPSTYSYSEVSPHNNVTYSATLNKSGNSISKVIKGSPSVTKYVTEQMTPNYNESIKDNQIDTSYVGTLTQYVYSGAAPVSKTGTKVITSPINEFPSTTNYSDGQGYSGTLNKVGNVGIAVVKGSDTNTKYVDAQTDPNYHEDVINDNGITTSYTGTLTQYVYSGSPTETKTVTITEDNLVDEFPETITHTEGDNFEGVLTKTGESKPVIIRGSDTVTKNVTAQMNPEYLETINDNGIETSYTGTLTRYVYSGSDVTSRTANTSQTKSTNEFPETVSHTEGEYTGTLSKNGSVITNVVNGSNTASKQVTNQTNQNYSEYVNDNGIGTYYTGTLTQYVASGYAPDSKVSSTTRSNSTGAFDASVSHTDGLYTGTIPKSGSPTATQTGGSPADSKFVNAQTSSWYNDGTYSGSLYSYVYSGSDAGSTWVSGQYNSYYNDGTYSGYLSSYVYSGSAPQSKYVSGQTSSWYNDGWYSGYLSPSGSYVSAGSSYNSKSVRQYWGYYRYGWHCSGYNHTYKNEAAGALEYLYTSNLSGSSKQYYESYWDNGVSTSYTGTLYPRKYSGYHPEPYLRIGDCGGKVTSSTRERWQVEVWWEGTASKPDTRVTTTTYAGTVYTADTRQYRYQGTVYKPDTRQYRYQGTVYKPDTRTYWYTQTYSGTIYRPDSRVYRYQGTVTKPDTRVYSYTQNYTGTITKPDTRVYRYQGNVTKPDTRVYGYIQDYTGSITKPDTRVYRYQGDVTKPDTRVYEYAQNYSGTVWTEDTRVYRYQGNVTKPDTRVYEYTQNYIGSIYIPDIPIYRYQGHVNKEAQDTRVIDYLYEYILELSYYKK